MLGNPWVALARKKTEEIRKRKQWKEEGGCGVWGRELTRHFGTELNKDAIIRKKWIAICKLDAEMEIQHRQLGIPKYSCLS